MSSSNEKKVPEVQFKGFSADWEQRKFSDIFNRVKSYSLSRHVETSENTGIKYIHYGDIHTKVADKVSNVSKIPYIIQDEYEFLNKGDLILADASEDYQGIATPAIIIEELKFNVVAGLHTIALRPKNMNSLYLYYLIKSPIFRRYGYKVGTGMKVFGVSVSSILNFETPVPIFEEQTKIGKFINTIDDMITLHQRKLELLKQMKQGFMQVMFPQNEENVPRLRFSEFEYRWEQRKFIELLDVKDGIRRGPFGSALKKDLFVPQSDYVVYEQQNAIYDKWETRYNITKEKFDELNKFILNEGDFIMSGTGTIGRIAKVPKGIKQGVFNQALIRFRINQQLTNSDYFLEWIRSDYMQRQFTKANPGSAMTNLVPMSEVKEWTVLVPNLTEQRKIGIFFIELSEIIMLHQHKINKLNSFKKIYLQKMFI